MNDLQRRWHDDGYLIVRGVFDAPTVARLLPIAERVIDVWRERDALSGEPGGANGTTLFHGHHPAYHVGHRHDQVELFAAGAHPRVLEIARLALGDEPLLRSQSLWFNPQGGSRAGGWHRDWQFIHPDRAVERSVSEPMIAAGTSGNTQFQIALVANDDLEVVPGSHRRWDTSEEYAIRRSDDPAQQSRDDMPGALRLALGTGDGVIFDPQMLHRGRYHADRPRRTFMVTTSTMAARMDDFFTRQPWLLDDGALDGLDPATRACYRRFIDTFAAGWSAAAVGA